MKYVTEKHYIKSLIGAGGFDSADGKIVRFKLKGIFKPKFDFDVRLAKVYLHGVLMHVQSLVLYFGCLPN